MSQLIVANVAAPFFLSQTGNIWLFVSIIPVEMIVVFLCLKSAEIAISFPRLFIAVLVANIATSILGIPLVLSTLMHKNIFSLPRDINNISKESLAICLILSFIIESVIYDCFFAREKFELSRCQIILFSLLSNLASYMIFIPALTGFNYNTGGNSVLIPNHRVVVRELRGFAHNYTRMQNRSYYEKGRFADNWQELDFALKETSFYTWYHKFYRLDIQGDATTANFTVASKTKELKSYRLTIFIVKDKDNYQFIQGICETDKPSMIAPEIPQLVNGKFQCPPGSSDKSDKFGLRDR
ncbi:type IV pilin-like G/H family protein [Microcoleus sp. F10-C6]|uniref:type IV pilin-like G/H family protein n=1 Tax=unclassified Microcoleus TaxID=2642155 RepID=UPI002FCF7FA1